MLFFWILVFALSLAVLIKGADWLISGAEKIGLSLGLSHFLIGITIVALGTSLPELVSSLVAVLKGLTDVPIANAVGSNIANILMVAGLSAIVGKNLTVSKNLIDLDLPLLAIVTVLFLGVVWDKQITFFESILLLVAFFIYFLYTIIRREGGEKTDETTSVLPHYGHTESKTEKKQKKPGFIRPKIKAKDIFFLIIGLIGITLGSKFLIDALIALSAMLNIAPGVIAATAVALGTSLPELLVSVQAAWQKKPEIALGNIFGSNAFNILFVVGLPGLFATLKADSQTFAIGIPVLAVATLLFVISGISKRINSWEGAFFLLLYFYFIGKIFNWL